MRPCQTCKIEKPENDYRDRRPHCRECERAGHRAYGKANRGKRNARLRKWRRDNPEAARALDRRKALKKNYGLTPEQVDQMTADQGGRCAICTKETDLLIDHCHETGEVRALLCVTCNTMIGWIENNPGVLDNARAYLDR